MNRKSKQEVLVGLGAAPRELPDVPHAELPVDHAERDRILATAMQHLSSHNIAYVLLTSKRTSKFHTSETIATGSEKRCVGGCASSGETRDLPPRAPREDPRRRD